MRSIGSIVAISTLLMVSPFALSPRGPGNFMGLQLSPVGSAIALSPEFSEFENNGSEGGEGEAAIANVPSFGIDGVNFNQEATVESDLEPESSTDSTMPSQNPMNNGSAPLIRFSDDEMTTYNTYRQVIEQTVGMTFDGTAQTLAQAYGLDILNVTWEDTGRFNNSAVGPNISDMTIQVQQQNPQTGDYQLHLMPVIRYPNFTDTTADIPIDRFYVPVGNEKGEELRSVSLEELLGNLRLYLSEPDSWTSRENSLLADRDSHVLVSAQACFLPVPQEGRAEFNPVLFNYQSYPENPAVLTILATREGTSVTIIDNQRDGFEAGLTWGQRLFFNQNGDRASLTGQRISDFLTPDPEDTYEPSTTGPSAAEPTEDTESDGLNLVMLIQVPLKQTNAYRSGEEDLSMAMPSAAMDSMMLESAGDVEAAVIGHGEVEGPFTEIDGLAIERDPDFPIRVTVQFYKATSNGIVSETDMQDIRQQIAKVYAEADYVGSLVVDGLTGRPTEYDGPHEEPVGWWDQFWRRYEENMGRSREDAMDLWRRLTGQE
ncbi:MAG: hypothetical protein AB4042_10225 [Leptolyngbyaceae cyanobacterium]